MTGLGGFAALLMAGPALARSAQQVAGGFIRDLSRAATSGREAVFDVFEEYVDMNYVFDRILAQHEDLFQGNQRQRMMSALARYMGADATYWMQFVDQNGQIVLSGERVGSRGTEVSMTFRPRNPDLGLSNGSYPLRVLVGPDAQSGRLMVRDIGSPEQSWLTESMAQSLMELRGITADPEDWIESFGG